MCEELTLFIPPCPGSYSHMRKGTIIYDLTSARRGKLNNAHFSTKKTLGKKDDNSHKDNCN